MANYASQRSAVEASRGDGWLRRFGQWLSAFLVIGALTSAFAFYLPLHRAHRALSMEHAALLEQNRGLERDLSRAGGELSSAQAARVALENETAQAKARVASEKNRVEAALTVFREKLAPLVDRKVLSIEIRDEQLSLSFAPALVDGLEARPVPFVAARLGLCEIAAVVSGEPSRSVKVIAYPGSATTAPVTAKTPGKWENASRLAALIAESLESGCGLPVGKTSAVVEGGPSTTNTKLELAIDVGRTGA